jgi:hypothetical protein
MEFNNVKEFVEKYKVAIVIIVIAAVMFTLYFEKPSWFGRDKFETIENTELDNILNSDINDMDIPIQNPIDQNIDPYRNQIADVNTTALNQLIKEVNIGNSIPVMSNNELEFQKKVNGPNKATNGYRKVSYADSNYRMDSNDSEMSIDSQNKLDKLYSDAVIFRDSEYQNNANFVGKSENMDNYANANLNNYKSGPETQTQKIMNMYNSNNYLPKNSQSQSDDGFQIVNNPVSVDNPNLIPVLRAMPVATTVGNKRNMSRDLRGDPMSNPKLVVAPWNNSSIQPDIYSTNRGCL